MIALRDDLARRLSPEVRSGRLFEYRGGLPTTRHGPQAIACSPVDGVPGGPVGRGTAVRNTPTAPLARAVIRLSSIWADRPERHASSPYRDACAYRNRVAGLCCSLGRTPAISDMTYDEKVTHDAKQNLLACSLHPIAYENKPGFQKFREATRPLQVQDGLRKADLDERG